MNEQSYRYEFRVFDTDFTALEARLRILAPLDSYRESLEIYLQIPGRHDLNLKIRENALELKRLHLRYRDLEQWRPEFRLELPVSRERLAQQLHQLSPGLALPSEPQLLDKERIVQCLTQSGSDVVAVSLFKKRFGFKTGHCRAEVDDLYINGARIMSLAIESEHPDAVIALRQRLGLTEWTNTGYTLAIDRILGRARLPGRLFYNAFVSDQGEEDRHAPLGDPSS